MATFNPQNEITELQAIVWGRVQGVGFRVTARQYALKLGLKGTVANLKDGNVEIIAQGPRTNLEKLIKQIKDHYPSGYIARMDTRFEKPIQSYEGFRII